MTLVKGIRNWPMILVLPFRDKGSYSVICLRNGTRYAVRSLMDVWIIKETNLDRDYERYGVPIQDG